MSAMALSIRERVPRAVPSRCQLLASSLPTKEHEALFVRMSLVWRVTEDCAVRRSEWTPAGCANEKGTARPHGGEAQPLRGRRGRDNLTVSRKTTTGWLKWRRPRAPLSWRCSCAWRGRAGAEDFCLLTVSASQCQPAQHRARFALSAVVRELRGQTSRSAAQAHGRSCARRTSSRAQARGQSCARARDPTPELSCRDDSRCVRQAQTHREMRLPRRSGTGPRLQEPAN